MSELVEKRRRGRPRLEDAKRNGINLRLSADEANTLARMSRESGRSRTDILLESVRAEMRR